MGKSDKRRHDRTKAPDFADRWVVTFGRREGKTEALGRTVLPSEEETLTEMRLNRRLLDEPPP